MASLPTGAIKSVATAFAAAKIVTEITNAAEAVCTCADHGYDVGDIVIFTSGWGRLNNRVLRIKSVPTVDTFTLEGKKANTTNTTFYPPGSGAGTVSKATTWVQIVQVLSANSSGGETKKVQFRYLEDESEQEINNGFTAISRSMELDADSIDSPSYNALLDLTEAQTTTIMRSIMKNGAVSYLPCTIALNEEVVETDGQVNRVKLDISGKSRSTRYAS